MKKILIAILFFILGVVLFMPKINLLYTLEGLLKQEHIELREDSLKDRWIDLNLQNALVLYDGVESLQARVLTISPWLFYNTIKAYDVEPSSTLKNMLNVKADSVSITHSLLDYKKANIEAIGDFGKIYGDIDLKKRKVKLILEASDSFKNDKIIKDFFKKSEEGLVYESKF